MIMTRVVKIDLARIDEHLIQEAAKALASGGLVILPTETVYGIAANMSDNKAVERLYKVKERPRDKPFSLLIDQKMQIEDFARAIPTAAYKLIDKFWPGPLTLVLKSTREGTVGMRMPDHIVALKVVAFSGVPVICPSANLSGEPAPKTFGEALKAFGGKADFAIDAGASRLGIESSVVDLTVDPLLVLREGAIKKEEIEAAAGKKTILFVCTGNSCRSVMAEALLKKILKEKKRDDVEVASAGVMNLGGMGATEATKNALEKEGIDVSEHRSRKITKEMLKKSDLILIMESAQERRIVELAPEIKNRLFLLKEFAKIKDGDLDIPDPINKPAEFYDKTLGLIKEAVERISNII
ncbi:MAG TPA: L-threonylcarbamoyladenylate synthase [Candidatus Margulisiibacteriota bacterium]|nr:L-threonylcarbamoyladenylate synthase [Candidatus Margulisiibacteriota bacterium]